MPLIATLANASIDGFYVPSFGVRSAFELVTPTSVDATSGTASISANGSVSFTTCTAIGINGAFTSDYDNYKIVYEADASQANVTLRAQLRLAGTNSTSINVYNYQRLNGSGASVNASASTSLGQFEFDTSDGAYRNGVTIIICRPFVAAPTVLHSWGSYDDTTIELGSMCGTHELSTGYDGISFNVATGSITGSISIYGLG